MHAECGTDPAPRASLHSPTAATASGAVSAVSLSARAAASAVMGVRKGSAHGRGAKPQPLCVQRHA